MEFLGWLLVVAGIALGLRTWRRKTAANRLALGLAAVAALLLGGYLALSPRWALANRQSIDMSRVADWVVGGPPEAIRWEAAAGSGSAGSPRWRRLTARLQVESESYAAFPVDWDGTAFDAEWDMTLTQLDVRPEWGERASVCIGISDGSVANVDDPDHVGGAALEACFSDDVRLRASDQDRLLKTHSATEKSLDASSGETFTPSAPIRLALNTPYHCRLAYDGPTDSATLAVTQAGRAVAVRELRDLRDYPSGVAWFTVTVRNYKRFNKQLAEKLKEKGYTKPTAEVMVENLRYRQP